MSQLISILSASSTFIHWTMAGGNGWFRTHSCSGSGQCGLGRGPSSDRKVCLSSRGKAQEWGEGTLKGVYYVSVQRT